MNWLEIEQRWSEMTRRAQQTGSVRSSSVKGRAVTDPLIAPLDGAPTISGTPILTVTTEA